jgi:hypothetical protein
LTTEKIRVHRNPVWRDEADFMIFARVEEPGRFPFWEQLWSRRIDASRFKICCIPFFARDIALGDVVEVGPSRGRQYVVSRVTKRSGHYAYRVWFGTSSAPAAARRDVVSHIQRLGCRIEFYSENLLAIDADARAAREIVAFLEEGESRGDLAWEAGNTR